MYNHSFLFCGVGSNQGRSIYFYTFKTTITLCIWVFINIRLSFENYICMHFCFNPFSVRTRLTMHQLYFNAYACMYMCHVCRCARIMQIHIPMIAEVKCFSGKTCFMCTKCTLCYVGCSNGTMNNSSTARLSYRQISGLRARMHL